MNLFPIHIRSSYMINYYSNEWQFMSQRLYARQGHKKWPYLNKNTLSVYIFLCVFWGSEVIYFHLLFFYWTYIFQCYHSFHCSNKNALPSKTSKPWIRVKIWWRNLKCIKPLTVLVLSPKTFLRSEQQQYKLFESILRTY